ncbi:DNA-binding SARP family transcriptional activator [Amycolatopsis sulphurea]|uniref:DNA-binding SARP family transcriptional activator n=1 Tax=Amycolatopsis sulphurea TaxID=76022 RepID=A0A2A9FGV0_9PSEU|nr:BTAD domain-containing putative transcriptional regulator [Amycolatopsis sulphurea]PFG50153.1 DNA-binding SARP family transcriptional activator [Amycolatopsis sulphurea]
MTSTSHQSGREPTRSPGAGRRVWWALASMFRFGGRVLRGLIGAAVLLALVAGLPGALWRYVGWPLPNHVPTWAEVQGVLLGPMTTTFLLDFLACLCWITWAAFTIDVLRCTADLARSGFDAARLPAFSAAGPMHALAAVLVGAVLLAVLGNRPAPAPPTSLSTALGTGSQVVATAPAWQHPFPAGETPVARNAVFTTQTTTGDSTTVAAPTHPESVVVLAPQNGVHDSLSRIAERTLDDGARWPEIFALNKGKPQPNGHTFTKPSLIFPGEELALPRDASAPAMPPQQPADPDQSAPAPPTTTVPPPSIQPSTPAQPAPSPQQAPPPTSGTTSAPATSEPGFRWGPELFVGLGLAAAISTALLVARRRHNSRYRPGSGDRDDLPVAPVVYQLRLAHLRSETDDEIDLDKDYPDDEEQQRPQRVPPAPPLVVGTPQTGGGRPPTVAPGLGVRDGREVALDLATARGLGLVGAGAPAAIHALLITALTTSPDHPATSAGTIVVPADDLVSVLGRGATQAHLPSAVRVVANLEDALDALEAETLVRATDSREPDAEPGTCPPLVLVARPPAHHPRLQAILDNGAPFGVTGLLLGQWQPGVTAYVRDDGTISATGPGLGEALRGTQMFRLGDDDAAELLALLRQAEPDPPATDDLVAPPVPRPRIVAAHPAGNDQAPGDADPLETGGSGADEIELEVTAAAMAPAAPDTELEILGPAQVQPPGVRLRPPAPSGRQAAPRLADDETEHHDEGEADEPASTSEPAKPVAETPPTTTSSSSGEQGTSAALITVTVLGDLRVHWHPEPGATSDAHEITGALQPRTKELLVLLALHPDGATRETLVSALWGQHPPARPTNALHTALSRMRSTLAAATNGTVTDIVSASNGRYQLDPTNVRSDYWRFANAVAARRAAATDSARVDAYRDVVSSYGGPLAEGMSNEWIEPAREAIRRDAIDAVAALARALVDSDPQQTLDLLEVARAFDPHNELLYRDIMRLQERLGQLDAIPRTLTLLTTRLAEIDVTPTPQARGLAARLGQRHEDDSAGATSAQAQGERGRIAAS